MRNSEPTIASVVTNPTARDLKYKWIGSNGVIIKAGQTVVYPYCVYTAGTKTQKAELTQALQTKMVKLKYRVAGGVEVDHVTAITDGIVYETEQKQIEAAAKAAEKAAEPKKSREKIINAVGDGKDAVEDSKDIVQKATGQETVSMRDAMGWQEPGTSDTRQGQDAEVVSMDEALTENIGDPVEKAAKAAEKEQAQEAVKTAQEIEADKAKAEADAEAAAAAKRSAASKKAAETRKKKAAAKKAETK